MINLLLSETKRSETYLRYIQKNKIKVSIIVYFGTKRNKVYKIIRAKKYLKKKFYVNSNTVNSPLVEKVLFKINDNNPIIFSGYSGEIIKNKNILKKNLIHFHPGDLPSYKGSTTLFYSLILEKKITVSCFRMTEAIDEGIIFYKKIFKKPKKLNKINSLFDDKIRAQTMIEFLKKGKKIYKVRLNSQNFSVYYIAHPIIRGIVLHRKKLKQFYA